MSDYLGKVAAAESLDGSDNKAGSGAFSRFQFMPATARDLAQGTPWGQGLTPEQVKAAVTADPNKATELANLYGQRSTAAIKSAGLPDTDVTRFAMHRFGQAGGTSLMRADSAMPVADWARSINWGNGVSPDAVITQNRLDRYSNVGDLRARFIGGPMGAPQSVVRLPTAAPGAQEPAAPAPVAAGAAPPLRAPQPPGITLADLFAPSEFDQAQQVRATADRQRRALLFG